MSLITYITRQERGKGEKIKENGSAEERCKHASYVKGRASRNSLTKFNNRLLQH